MKPASIKDNEDMLNAEHHEWKEKYEGLRREYEEFAYVVSHDLNAPFRQINGFTTILLKELGTDLNEEQQLYYDMIKYALNQAEETLQALLEYSRLNTNKKHFKDIDTKALLRSIIKTLEPVAKESAAKISTKNLPESIYADEKSITIALTHIIDNAIKFQPEGHIPRIEISAKIDAEKTIFCIDDNGIGMDKEKIPLAFTILKKLQADDEYKGRGVGLTFAKKIAQIHGGDTRIEVKDDHGIKVFMSIKNTP